MFLCGCTRRVLEKLRYRLVGKLLAEADFWQNFFYRVHVAIQKSKASES